MMDRRQTFAALGSLAMTAVATRPLWAAASIKIDDTSALLVISTSWVSRSRRLNARCTPRR